MYTISKQFRFSASHTLKVPKGHPCGRLHGHNYIVEVVLQSEGLDEYGFVVDYGDLDYFKNYLNTIVDHQHLNEVFNFNPTAENLARYFYHIAKLDWPQVTEVRVSETKKTWASYTP